MNWGTGVLVALFFFVGESLDFGMMACGYFNGQAGSNEIASSREAAVKARETFECRKTPSGTIRKYGCDGFRNSPDCKIDEDPDSAPLAGADATLFIDGCDEDSFPPEINLVTMS